jgi:hypothetical protein
MQYFHLFWVPWDCLAFRKPRPLSTYTFALDVPPLGPLRSHRYVPEQRIWPQEADGSMDKAAFRHRHIDTVKLLTIRCPWLCLPGQDRSFGRRQLRLTRVWTAQPDIRQPRSRLGEKVSKHQRASGNFDHGEPAYDLSALFDPMVTVSRCLDPVCSLALPLVKPVAPAGGRASPGSST